MKTPTSVPGISISRPFSRRGRFKPGSLCHESVCRGFTLLEILVVTAIIGLFVGIVVLSTDLAGFERRLEQEARRLSTLIDFASDEALLQTQDFGLFVCEDSYHFFVYNYEVDDWTPYSARPFEARTLDPEMFALLRIDDREVVLSPSAADAFPRDWSSPPTEDELEDMPDPQIVILSSGEVTPFQIEFLRRSQAFDPGVVLNVAFDGESEIEQNAF